MLFRGSKLPADLRALVLVAGQGMRLRPLTETVPKALLPILGRPLAGLTLSRLAAAGCQAAALNLHHLGPAIRDRFGERHGPMPLTYSPEPRLLGTSGALVPLRDFLKPAELVLVVNGDSLCKWPIKKLIRRHVQSGAAASLLVSKKADPAEYGGGIEIDQSGSVVSFRSHAVEGAGERRRVFMGAHVFSPDLIDRLGEGPSDFVSDIWEPVIRDGGRINVVETRAKWHDLGTPARYLAGVLDWHKPWLPGSGSWIHANATVEKGTRLRRAVIEDGASVAAGAVVENSLVLPGASIATGCQVRDSIVGHSVALGPGTGTERRMVTSMAVGSSPREVDSVVGDHVFTPL